MPGQLAPHEALQLHELMRIENLGVIKLQAMMPVAADDELKRAMQEMLPRKQARLQRMREFAQAAIT